MKLLFPAAIICAIACNSAATTEEHPVAAVPNTDFVDMFDGKTLANWEGDTSFWKVVNGVITAEETPEHGLKNNTFLIYTGATPDDFEFKADYRISADGNSGVQYRSTRVEGIPYALKGYQADIDGANTYTGQNYEERGRGFLAMRGQRVVVPNGAKPDSVGTVGPSDSLKALIKTNDWNSIRIVAKGNNIKHYINEVLMSETTDNDTELRRFSGLIGLQLHVAPAMKVEYRNLKIK